MVLFTRAGLSNYPRTSFGDPSSNQGGSGYTWSSGYWGFWG